MKTKTLAIIFSILLIATAVSGAVVFVTQNKPASFAVTPEVLPETEKSTPTAQTIKPEAEKKLIEAKNEKPAEQGVAVSLVIDGKKFDESVPAGSSVYDLMEKLKSLGKISFSGRDYAELGFFVEEINGVKNDPAGKNWIYYVDGKPAQVGVSYYKLKQGDLIEWKYEKQNF